MNDHTDGARLILDFLFSQDAMETDDQQDFLAHLLTEAAASNAIEAVKLLIDTYGADATRMFLVNSPIVRGDNLRFREAGVREVVSRVLLPWLNAFRFFLGQVQLHRKTGEFEFMYNPHASKVKGGNVMDRWILARCQSLIKLVREEMAAYRLYTIIPRLLDLVDELTNWYIRFNRRRLKGEDGVEDTVAALNTLFETLLTLCQTMVRRNRH